MILTMLALGHVLSLFLPLPAPVFGLILCAVTCATLSEVPKSLLLTSQLLLNNMALFFLPLIVSATLYIDLIRENWLPILVSLILSTLVAIAITAKLADINLAGKTDE